jgi:dCMP deaminase
MEIAKIVAQRSVCKHWKVGAVFVKENRILAVGYNGPPRGEPHCFEVGCAKEKDGKVLPSGSGLCRGAHAEINAITNAAKEGIHLKGCKVYCTYTPCYDCAKALINLEITEYVYLKKFPYFDPQGAELFRRRGIIFRKF